MEERMSMDEKNVLLKVENLRQYFKMGPGR